MDPGNPDLVAFIRETIRRDGPVRFDWFMEQALYHPQFGYHSTGQCQIGRHGDYFTNVSVGPVFGRMLATQFAEMWEIMGQPDNFTVVEQGAHHGEFAHDVLTAMREFRAKLRYCIVQFCRRGRRKRWPNSGTNSPGRNRSPSLSLFPAFIFPTN